MQNNVAYEPNDQGTHLFMRLHVHPEWLNKKNDRPSTEQVPGKYRAR